MHGDHYFGLVGLLSTMNLLGREKELIIYGPEELEALINPMINYGGSRLSFNLVFVAINMKGKQTI